MDKVKKDKSSNVPLKVTSLDELRRQANERARGTVLQLPSGLVLRVTQPSLSRMLREKRIPQNLVSAAVRVSTNKDAMTAAELSENIELMEHLLKSSILEPEGMTDEDIMSMSDDDKGVCFLFIQEGVTDLDSFRNKQLRQVSGSRVQKVSRQKTK